LESACRDEIDGGIRAVNSISVRRSALAKSRGGGDENTLSVSFSDHRANKVPEGGDAFGAGCTPVFDLDRNRLVCLDEDQVDSSVARSADMVNVVRAPVSSGRTAR
jgi:hypothetical protein